MSVFRILGNALGSIILCWVFLLDLFDKWEKSRNLYVWIKTHMGLVTGKRARTALAGIGLVIIVISNSSSLQGYIHSLIPISSEELARRLQADDLISRDHKALTKRLNEWIEDVEIRINAEGPLQLHRR